DNYGRPLTRPADESGMVSGAVQVERQQQIERELSTRVASLLEPIVGANRVRVNVSARMRLDTQEETEERWDPTTVVGSRQSVNQGGSQIAPAQGVAGTRANLPDTAKAAAAVSTAAASAAPTNPSEVTNYEVSRLTRHR